MLSLCLESYNQFGYCSLLRIHIMASDTLFSKVVWQRTWNIEEFKTTKPRPAFSRLGLGWIVERVNFRGVYTPPSLHIYRHHQQSNQTWKKRKKYHRRKFRHKKKHKKFSPGKNSTDVISEFNLWSLFLSQTDRHSIITYISSWWSLGPGRPLAGWA